MAGSADIPSTETPAHHICHILLSKSKYFFEIGQQFTMLTTVSSQLNLTLIDKGFFVT